MEPPQNGHSWPKSALFCLWEIAHFYKKLLHAKTVGATVPVFGEQSGDVPGNFFSDPCLHGGTRPNWSQPPTSWYLSSGFLSVGKKSCHAKTVVVTVPIFGEPSDDVTGQLSWDTRLRGALALIYVARKPPKGTKFPTRPSWKKKFFRITPFLTKSLKNIKKWALQSFRSVALTEPSQNCHFLKKKIQNFFFSELPNFWQKCQKTLKSKPRKISDQSH